MLEYHIISTKSCPVPKVTTCDHFPSPSAQPWWLLESASQVDTSPARSLQFITTVTATAKYYDLCLCVSLGHGVQRASILEPLQLAGVEGV